MKDITYCMMDCGNTDCHRNADKLKPGEIASCSFFSDCEDFIFVPLATDDFVIGESGE